RRRLSWVAKVTAACSFRFAPASRTPNRPAARTVCGGPQRPFPCEVGASKMQHSDVGVDRRTDLNAELTALGTDCLTAGRVLAQYTDRWLVATPGEQLDGRLVPARGRLRRAAEGPPVT